MKTTVILNGPPGVGKDTIARMFSQRYGYHHMEFKDALFQAAAKYFQVELAVFKARHADRELKEKPWDKLKLNLQFMPYTLFLSTREALIFTSEVVVKPWEGLAYFGRAAAQQCRQISWDRQASFIFSDGGFADETRPMLEAFEKVYIIQLHRDGYTFQGDSRNYVHGFANTFPLHLIDNRPELAVQAIADIIGEDLGQAT